MMRLPDEGRLDIERTVQSYLPEFTLADDEAARDVRLWHLLTHTPGWEGQLDTPVRHSTASFAGPIALLVACLRA